MIEQLRDIDRTLFYFINQDLSNRVFDFLCPILREKLTWAPLYILIAYFAFRRYGKSVLWLGALAALTILCSDQISNLFKHSIHRLRPCNNPELAGEVRLLIAHCGAGFSFVSAHAANHFALAVFLSVVWRSTKVTSLLLLWAFAIAFSQVYVGIHYPADVFAGACIGVMVGSIIGLAAKKWVLKLKE